MADMLRSTAIKPSSHPRRTLLFVVLFVVVAGVLGARSPAPYEGLGRVRAAELRLRARHADAQSATGAEPDPGIVLVVNTPRGPGASAARIDTLRSRLAAVPGIKRSVGPAVSRDRREALIAGTLRCERRRPARRQRDAGRVQRQP